MASNITNAATMVLANMKPTSGEQISSLWGQNLGDNTGYVYYRKTQGPSYSGWKSYTQSAIDNGTTRATMYVNHRSEWPYLIGSFTMMGSYGAGAAQTTASFYMNGVFIKGTSFTLNSQTKVASGYFTYDKSALTDNTDYPLTILWAQSDPNTGDGIWELTMTTWQAQTI